MRHAPKRQDPDATRPNPAVDPSVAETRENVWEAPALDAQATQVGVAAKLDLAREAARLGDRERAYQLCQEVLQLDPNNVEAWLRCAALTASGEERLAYLNKVLSLSPQHTKAKYGVYTTLRHYLEHNPFLRYLDESSTLYQVLTGEGRAITVPKDRAVAPPFPPTKPPPLQPVFRWLGFALLGLPLAGIPTVVCAALAVALVWRVSQEPLNRRERRRALIALFGAGILGAIGAALSFLFVLHLW